MWIQIPRQSKYVETITIYFELIAIKGNTCKCSGCGGNLKDGPDPLLVHDLCKTICIRHKEKDCFFNKEHNFGKPTYGNHHYDIFPDCLTNRNPSFIQWNLVITLDLDSKLKFFWYNRFHWSSCDTSFFIFFYHLFYLFFYLYFFAWASIFLT